MMCQCLGRQSLSLTESGQRGGLVFPLHPAIMARYDPSDCETGNAPSSFLMAYHLYRCPGSAVTLPPGWVADSPH